MQDNAKDPERHARRMAAKQQIMQSRIDLAKKEQGVLLVLTGPGKGKSSSGFGMLARALGHGMKVGVVQFIKGKFSTGEEAFFRDLPARMSEAQLVISRAGASSIADISVIGRPAILVPYAAAAADHQTANARGLVTAGGAIRIPESKLDAASLSAQIAAVLDDPKGAGLMAQAALSQGLPDAPQKLADLVEELAWKLDGKDGTP